MEKQSEEQQPQRSYFERRIWDELGLTPEQNKIELYHGDDDDWRSSGQRGTFDIFSEDKHGNIKILVYSIDGSVREYIDPNEGQTRQQSSRHKMLQYYVTRVAPQNIKSDDDPKYRFPKGQGVSPFFPPKLLEKFRLGTKIKELVLTEGYIKAMCASMNGIDIVGLGSITHYADSNTRELHPDIRRLIIKCEVEKVILLYDGDCTNISMKDFEAGRDLARRPKVFYDSIINTRDLLIDFDIKIDFAYVRSDQLVGNPKGIDDLLLSTYYKHQLSDIIKDLTDNSFNNQYFMRMNVREQVQRLKKKFFLESPTVFYKHWADVIGDKEFIYERMHYQYSEEEDRALRKATVDIDNYIRVGDVYYEIVPIPNIQTGGYEKQLKSRNKGTIIDDLGRDQLKYIKKYKAFVNVPSHIDYKPVIDDCWNNYCPLDFTEDPNCEFPTIRSLMEHIFGEQIELGYDYMQLLYLKPMQILPILCLVSNERQTGKTSFLDLLRTMFGGNAAIVGNSEITSEFNAFVSTKLIVGVDETSLADNVKVAERLKMLSTAKKVPMQRKGKDHEEVDNFTKYVLCSNSETRFIYTQEDEIRFWVRKIVPFEENVIIGNILPNLHEEIPGFMAFLHSRKMFIEESRHSRMWFSAEDIHTEALDKLKADQMPKAAKEVKAVISQLFMNFPALEYIISVKVLKQMVPILKSFTNDSIHDLQRTYFGVEGVRDKDGACKTKYIRIPYYEASTNSKEDEGEEGDFVIKYFKDKAKGFRFKAERFLEPSDLEYVRKVSLGLIPQEKNIKAPSDAPSGVEKTDD